MAKLPQAFYTRDNVVEISQDLLGKVLYTCTDGQLTAGIITETEAYAGETDKACHAYGGRRTKRTQTMYEVGGTVYVYLCYGIHHLFNVVTNVEGIPHVCLVRAISPKEGLDTMLARRKKDKIGPKFSGGPGTASQALGISTKLNGRSLLDDEIWIEDLGFKVRSEDIEIGPRIGIDYAEEDKFRPYRFLLKSNNQIFSSL